MLTTGEMIRERRDQCGLNQRDLAKSIGVSTAMMCRIENGTRKPNAALMRKIMTVLGGFQYDIDTTYDISNVDDRLAAFRILEKRVDDTIHNLKVTKKLIKQLIEEEEKELEEDG